VGRHPIVLVTGAGGQVGRALRPHLPDARFLSHTELDTTDALSVSAAIEGTEAVIHLAAMTHVDDCEVETERAWAVNAEGTRHVAEAASEAGARLVYLSTDYVFDGTKQGEYMEDDPPKPINVYGKSKLEGERHARTVPGSAIVRTSWVIGEGRNFVRTIVSAARDGKALRVVDDQRGRPSFADDLARAIVHLLEHEIEGVINVAGDEEPCTWADLAELAVRAVGLDSEVEHVDTETYGRIAARVIAPRPTNSVLSLEKARRLGVPLEEWRTSLERYVQEL
jgi:dTDP-4-dehydrorhamnose reductase